MSVLKQLRLARDLTQEEVSKRIDVPYRSYRHYEYGETFPKCSALIALAKLYGMSPGELFSLLIGENNDTLITDNNYEESTVMPILPMIDLPRPESPREFEYILREYCAETYGGHAQLYNNQGKEHFGVNIMINRPDGTRVYVLCRNYRNTKITVSDIDERVLEIDNAKFNMSEAVLVTSIFKPDPELQEHVYQISDERISKGLCPINIIFWNDIVYFVHNHPGMLERYWPQIAEKLAERTKEETSIPTVSAAGINTGYGLKNLFSEIYKRYQIEDYLRKDPFDGLSFEDLLTVNFFMETLHDIEDSAIYAKELTCYKQILKFESAFNDYNDYLSTICGISNTGKIAFLPPSTDYTTQEYIDNIASLKYRVYQCLADIKNDE